MNNEITCLGYLIKHGELRPDPDRLQGLRDLAVPTNSKELGRLKGLFAYYAKWIQNFSEKIACIKDPSFPLSEHCVKAIELVKGEISAAVRASVDPSEVFTVESDASDTAIGAVLSQKGRPVAFLVVVLTRPSVGIARSKKKRPLVWLQ